MFARTLFTLFVFVCLTTAAVAARYSITDLGSLPQNGGGASGTAPYGINNLGQVVGASFGHPFLWEDGRISAILGPTETGAALDINNFGQIVGRQGDAISNGFIFSDGVVTNLTFGLSKGTATAINDSGHVVGSADFGHGVEAFYFNGVTTVGLSDSGLPNSAALDINSAGRIVGHYSTSGDPQPFLFDTLSSQTEPLPLDRGTAFSINDAGAIAVFSDTNRAILIDEDHTYDIGSLGGANSMPLALNNLGDVVGSSLTANGRNGAFVYSSSGIMQNLNDPVSCAEWEFIRANDINDNGWIVGVGVLIDSVETQRGVLFVPTSEALPGDADGNDRVDIADLNAVRNNFGSVGEGDVNQDGMVDIADLNDVRNSFGALACTTSVPNTAVPEPSSLALVTITLAWALRVGKLARRPAAC